ncbi:hypothetical protein A1O1_02559 [Capronia coronata CBS 617.96]|uniref:Uncharacterized protein n=1 Tax=Capronia coronata CBS 617.96 TaxID=1182541 RepID=W9YY06_9EURO|nr:uncharacterized protein A1O1_02559 [Capronia coronata CBS 617.96]EXJ94166.1 hypothetical protein A1O1_02559 [Capronia coronata CBS 617.96]
MSAPSKKEILHILSTPSPREPPQTSILRQHAYNLISQSDDTTTTGTTSTTSNKNNSNNNNLNSLPNTIHELLTTTLKPLFTPTKHPSLTSTGRKNLLSSPTPALGSSLTRFHGFANDDELAIKPWKAAPFTVPLLHYILGSYASLPDHAQRKAAIEAHFFLLVPPLLNMIDDHDSRYKAAGCSLVRELCEVLRSAASDMLQRTGLGEVFADALRANFLMLPPLTPEGESLDVLGELYPAFLALVDARFGKSDDDGKVEVEVEVDVIAPTSTKNPPTQVTSNTKNPTTPAITNTTDATTTKRPNAGVGSETSDMGTRHQRQHQQTQTDIRPHPDPRDKQLRLSLLTTLYRHGISASLAHLASSASGSLSSSTSPMLTTYLLTQIPPVFNRLGITSVKHFQTLLPTLRVSLMDPFILVAPAMPMPIPQKRERGMNGKPTTTTTPMTMVQAILDVLQCVIRVGAPRVRDKWYPEILRGVVGCWCNCVDELHGDDGDSKIEDNGTDPATSTVTLKTSGEDENGTATERLAGEDESVRSKNKTNIATKDDIKAKEIRKVMVRLQDVVRSLGKIIPHEEWDDVLKRLIAEEKDLRGLFGISP